VFPREPFGAQPCVFAFSEIAVFRPMLLQKNRLMLQGLKSSARVPTVTQLSAAVDNLRVKW